MALALLLLRRGALGRMLIAMRDSPAACGTLGLDMRWFRVGLFGASAGMAGLAGALFAGLRGTIGAADFQFFGSLPLLLLAVVFGVTSVTGAALGGVGLMLLPVLQSEHPSSPGWCSRSSASARSRSAATRTAWPTCCSRSAAGSTGPARRPGPGSLRATARLPPPAPSRRTEPTSSPPRPIDRRPREVRAHVAA